MTAPLRGSIHLATGCISVVILDQWSKAVFFGTEKTFSFLHGWIQSVYHQNFGIAFNIPIPQWVILTITVVACIGILFLFFHTYKKSSFLPLFLGILLGGALGNAIDRSTLSYVRDWLLLWHRSAINFADISIVIGLIGTALLSPKHEDPPSASSE